MDVAAYGPVSDAAGARRLRLKVTGRRGGVVLAQIEGVADRNAAEALRGLRLYVPRAALPPPAEEEYYHADLIGLPVELEDGRAFGRVRALHDFGAGDVIEVQPDAGGTPLLLPFTRDFVPVVDLAGRRVVVAPPESLLASERGREGR
jgi:16S rRNA processing protein RimM